MNLENISDAELDAIIAGGDSSEDIKNISDVELDEIIATAPPEMLRQEDRGSFLNPLLEGLTLSWGDEAASALGAAYGVGMPESLGGLPDNVSFEDAYRGIKQGITEDTAEFKERNPNAAVGLQLAGAVATGGAGLSRFGASAATKPAIQRMIQNMVVGATEGGIVGAGEAENIKDVAVEAGKGAAFGLVGGLVGGELINKLSNRYRNESDIVDLLMDDFKSPYVQKKAAKLERMIQSGAEPEDIKTLDFEIKQAIRDSKASDIAATEKLKALPEQKLTDWTKKRFGEKSFTHKAQKKLLPPRVKVVDDEIAKDAENMGFARSIIAPIRQLASKSDVKRMNKILDRREYVHGNQYAAMKQRPSSILGDDFLRRINFVRNINKETGRKLGETIKGLEGKDVNFKAPIDDLKKDLSEMGIDYNSIATKEFKEGFKRSTVEGLSRYENAIKRVIKRVDEMENPSALDLHNLKIYMDQNVSHDKAMGGLGGQIDNMLKTFRYNINTTLKDNFPEYKKLNKTYSETIGILKEVEKATGGKSEWKGANEALGTELRKIFTNYASRVPLMESLGELENVAKKHGAKFSDDLFLNTMFNNALDERFGSVATGSLKGIMEKTGKTSVIDVLKGMDSMEVLEKGIKYLQSETPSDKEAFDSMRQLLKRV